MTVYRTIRVPDELVENVRSFIKENKKLGYRSASEFVIDSTRRILEDLQKSK